MAGTKLGGAKAAATNASKYGADYYRQIGAKGGRSSRGYAFAHGRVSPIEAGAKGGSISRRKKQND